MITHDTFIKYCELSHKRAEQWWFHSVTKEPLDRNAGEMIALLHSEVSEAWNAYATDSDDDHLPHRQGVEVELADTIIRMGDFLIGKDIDPSVVWKAMSLKRKKNTMTRFLDIHSGLSVVLEGFRKDETSEIIRGFGVAVCELLQICNHLNLDLEDAIKEKMEYNKNREDHKHANRVKPNGKKF